MKHLIVGVVALAAAFATSAAQDVPGQRDPQKGPQQKDTMGGWEVRCYLMDKDKKDVDLKDVTATLMIEEKPMSPAEKATTKKTIPMMLTTPKADERMPHHGQVREIEGGQYWVEMFVMKSGWRSGEGRGAYDKGTEKGAYDKGAEKGAYDKGTEKGTEYGKDQGTKEGMMRSHTGSYFRADVPADVAPKGEFMASVTFTVKGETKTARGFEHPFMMKGGMHKFMTDLRSLETSVNNGDWAQASTMANGMVDTMKAKNVKDTDMTCWSAAQDIKSAVDAKDKTKAQDAINKLRTHCEKEHKDMDGGSEKGDQYKGDQYKK